MNILPQITQITQRNAAKLHYIAEKDRLFEYCCFVVCLRKSARSAGDIGVSSVQIDRVLLRVILPQIAQMTQRNAALAALYRRERQVGDGCEIIAVIVVFVVIVVWGFVCVNLRDLRENRPFTHTKNYVDEYKEQQ